jgi:LemA protein
MEISMSVFSRLRSFAIATLLGLSVASCGYNTIPTLDENAKAKWAEVQAQYQRRADLIPNLVATVQGYAKQEKDVLTQVARQGDANQGRRLLAHRPRQDQTVPGRAGAA